MIQINQYNNKYLTLQTNTVEIPVNEIINVEFQKNNTFIIKTYNNQFIANKLQITINTKIRKRIRTIYANMISRCTNEKNPSFERYGNRGISVCNEWLSSFDNFLNWSLLNGYDDSLTIDRISNENGYSPSNCRWATRKQQSNNKSDNHIIEFNGKVKTISELADEFNIPYRILKNRINTCHWDIEKAITTPIKKHIDRKSNIGVIIFENKKYYKSDFCKLFNINQNTLNSQLQRGWTIEEIVNKKRNRKFLKSGII